MPGRSVVIDGPTARKYAAEFVGTAMLVFFGAGMATISFGFRAFGSSVAAGILLTGLVFGLVLTGLYALIAHISDCHVNPAVTLGAFLTRRISFIDMIGYWIAQLLGALLGALLLLWVLHASPFYTRARNGLGAQGYGRLSLLHVGGGGAFLTEILITAAFVLVVLAVTRKQPNAAVNAAVAGVVLGFALALSNIMGIAIDGASVNPARSFGPAIVVGGAYLSQLWLFLIAPMIGGLLAALVYVLLHPEERPGFAGGGPAGGAHAPAWSAADEDEARRTSATTMPQPGQVGGVRSGATGSQAGASSQPGAAQPGASQSGGQRGSFQPGQPPGASRPPNPGEPGSPGNPPQGPPPSAGPRR